MDKFIFYTRIEWNWKVLWFYSICKWTLNTIIEITYLLCLIKIFSKRYSEWRQKDSVYENIWAEIFAGFIFWGIIYNIHTSLMLSVRLNEFWLTVCNYIIITTIEILNISITPKSSLISLLSIPPPLSSPWQPHWCDMFSVPFPEFHIN